VKSAAAAITIAGMALASRAAAVEREHHVGIDAGGSVLVMNDKTDVGGGVGGHWAYGLSDAFNLMAEGSWSLVALGEKVQVAGTQGTHPTSVVNAGVGVGYVLDVLRWVPYAGLLAAGYALAGGTIAGVKVRPGVTIALGLDYRFDRKWAAGFAFRQHMLVSEMSTYPSFTQLFARLEYTWGW
jgi:hypothetical protein